MNNLITVEEALEKSINDIKRQHDDYLNPAFRKMLSLLSFDKKFVEAKGVKVWDESGIEYLDFLGGYGSLNLGHNPPEVFEAINMVKKKPNLLQASMGVLNASLGENLASITPGKLQHSYFCNSGAEAVEAAIKIARKSTGKQTIISTQGSFHGKTMGALSVSGREKYKQPFSPMLLKSKQVPFGDIEALRDEIDDDIAAIILEPIQGEGGIVEPTSNYLKEVRNICSQNNVLLIIDEIQTGLGRTGRLFGCEWEEVVPDIICLAKSLGGGVVPIGAMVTTSEVWNNAYGKIDEALLHTSTFGGNTVACAASIASINQIVKQKLDHQARKKGELLKEGLKKLQSKYSLIKDVRGKGLLVGVEFTSPEEGFLNKVSQGMISKLSKEYIGAFVAEKLQNDYNIITAYTLNNPNVIRLEPPLIVNEQEIEYVLESLDQLLDSYSDFYRLAFSSGKKAVSSILKRS
nr:aspartate aminotransferase family protein [Natranaerobius trueperi]